MHRSSLFLRSKFASILKVSLCSKFACAVIPNVSLRSNFVFYRVHCLPRVPCVLGDLGDSMRLAEAEQERLAREGETAVETAARLEEEKAALLAEAFSAEQTVGAALGAAREECEKLGRTVEGLRDGEKYTTNIRNI